MALAVEFFVSSVDSHQWKCKDVSFCAPKIISESEHQNVRWFLIDRLAGFHFQVTLNCDNSCPLLMCARKFFCLNLKWNCLHLKMISTCLQRLWPFWIFCCNLAESKMTVYILKLFWPSSKSGGLFFVYFVVKSYVCPRVPFLPGSKMTLFTFYNYFDLPLKPLASFLNLLLQFFMCFLKFVFCLNPKWHFLQIFWPSS